ncbi:phage tail family protein [Staphylococcus pseudintermedius]|nr:phage tail family protein [Staphylococcus pseudintermedius]
MNDTILVNGKSLPWLFVQRGFKIPSFNFAVKTEKVEGRPGSVYQGRSLNEYNFELPLVISNDHLAHSGIKSHDDILNDLVKFFNYEKSVKLQFKSKEWYWNARFEGPIELFSKTENHINVVNLKVVLTDPYKYSAKGNKNTAISDSVSVVNTGTADTPILVEARALKDVPYFMIAKNDEEYFMIGEDDTNKTVENLSPTVLTDELTSFNGWNTVGSGTQLVDNIVGGTVSGSFKIWDNGESFAIKDAGTGVGYHGPASKKTFARSVQDFNLIVKMYVNQRTISAGKAFSYVYDESNKLQFVIGFINQYKAKNESKIVVYAYNDLEEPKLIYEHKTHYSLKKFKAMAIYIQVVRTGKQFSIKSWKYDEPSKDKRSTPLDVNSSKYVDRGGMFQKKIRHITLFLGAYADYQEYLEINWLGVYLYEKLPKKKGVADYIIKRGDLVYVDTQAHSITIEGMPALDLKDFGSDFFKVKPGHTELVVHPFNSFDTTVKWQDRYF